MTAQPVDLSPLSKLDPDLSQGLTRAFSGWEALALAGVQQYDGSPRVDGVVEMWKKDYWGNEEEPWMIWAHAVLLDTTARAVDSLVRSCALAGQTFDSKLEPVADGSWRYCTSPIGQLRNDPAGGGLPSEFYVSCVGMQFDRLVVTLQESHRGDAKTAKNELIVELAERLAKLGRASPQSTATPLR